MSAAIGLSWKEIYESVLVSLGRSEGQSKTMGRGVTPKQTSVSSLQKHHSSYLTPTFIMNDLVIIHSTAAFLKELDPSMLDLQLTFLKTFFFILIIYKTYIPAGLS